MIPQAHISAWRAVAPWLDDAKVEQDLVLSRAVVELFAAPDLAGGLAPRGGTALRNGPCLSPWAGLSSALERLFERCAHE